MSNLQQQNRRKEIIEQDKLNRQTLFDPQKQFNPADLFILKGFSFGQALWERNPRRHDDRGYFIGGTLQ